MSIWILQVNLIEDFERKKILKNINIILPKSKQYIYNRKFKF